MCYSLFATPTHSAVSALPILLVAGLTVRADRFEGLGKGVLAFGGGGRGRQRVVPHLVGKSLEAGLVFPDLGAGFGIALVASIGEEIGDHCIVVRDGRYEGGRDGSVVGKVAAY